MSDEFKDKLNIANLSVGICYVFACIQGVGCGGLWGTGETLYTFWLVCFGRNCFPSGGKVTCSS